MGKMNRVRDIDNLKMVQGNDGDGDTDGDGDNDAYDPGDLKLPATPNSNNKSNSSNNNSSGAGAGGAGLSELSKQLRTLQAENYQKGNEIDKLERKLKIMADLKGVSIGDVKLALNQACEGEAFNELRSQVVTLRHQLALVDQGKRAEQGKRSFFEKQATSNKLANLELRVGELEEVEENLQAEIAKLYKQLRQQTAKATALEAKCDEQRNEIKDLTQQANDTNAAHELARREAELKEAQSEIERLLALLSKTQLELRKSKDKIRFLDEEVARLKLLETQCAQMKLKMEKLVATAAKDAKDRDEKYQTEIQGVMTNVDLLSKRAVDAETKAKQANERLHDYENQLKKLRDVEVQYEQQKEYIKDLKESSSRQLQEREEACRSVVDSTQNEIKTLRNHIKKLELELKGEKGLSSELEGALSSSRATIHDHEKKLQRLRALELECAQYKEQLREMQEEASRSHQEKDEAHKAASYSVMQEMQTLKDRAIQAEIQFRNERETVANLKEELATSRQKLLAHEKKMADFRALELECEQQRKQISSLRRDSERVLNERDRANKNILETTQKQIHELKDRAIKAEMALKQEEEQCFRLSRDTAKMSELEQLCAEQKQELDNLKKRHDKDLRDKDRKRKEDKKSSKADIEDLKNRIAEMELNQENDKQRISLLQKRLANMSELEEANAKLLSKLDKASGKAKSLGEKDKVSEKERDKAKEKIGALTKLVRDRDSKIKIEMEKVNNLETQLGAVERENKLRKKQFKSRFKVQEERVQDLEQQLSSLYTAFHIERDERKQEHETQAVLQMSLDNADSKVAHQLHSEEERTVGIRSPGTPSVSATPRAFDSTPTSYHSSSSTLQGSTSNFQSPEQKITVMEGYLSKKDNFKGWKRRYCVLAADLTTGIHTLIFTDGPGGKVKATLSGIRAGISTVAHCRDYVKHPHAFVLYENPRDPKAGFAIAASDQKDELQNWLDMLTTITSVVAKRVPVPSPTESAHQHPVGARVVIVDLRNCQEFNGCTGTVKTALKDGKQCVIIEETKQKVKLSPANLEIFSLEGVSPRKQLDFSDHQEQTDREIAMIMQETFNDSYT